MHAFKQSLSNGILMLVALLSARHAGCGVGLLATYPSGRVQGAASTMDQLGKWGELDKLLV